LEGDQLVARPLPTRGAAQSQNKRTQTSIPQVEFEPTTTLFERADDSSCLRPRSHRHRHVFTIGAKISTPCSLEVLYYKQEDRRFDSR
jgi:hypothetical protein